MINEFSVHAMPTNKNAIVISLASLAGAAVLFAAAWFTEEKKWIPQSLCLVLLVIGLMLLTRYVLPKFYYDVTVDTEGTPLFIVRQQNGKRQTTLCRIAFADIRKIEEETAKQRRAHKTPTGYIKYTYVPTLFPEKSYRIIAVSRYEHAEIVIECTPEMAGTLSELAAEARERRRKDEEEEEY